MCFVFLLSLFLVPSSSEFASIVTAYTICTLFTLLFLPLLKVGNRLLHGFPHEDLFPVVTTHCRDVMSNKLARNVFLNKFKLDQNSICSYSLPVSIAKHVSVSFENYIRKTSRAVEWILFKEAYR